MSGFVDSAADYLLQRIADVRRLRAREDGWRRQDRRDLVLEVAEYVRRELDVPRLEAQLRRQSAIDVAELTWAANALAASTAAVDPAKLHVRFADGTEYPWKERLESLRSLVATLGDAHTLEEVEVGLRLQLVADTAIAGLLVALPKPSKTHESFRRHVRAKLSHLPDQDAVDFWAKLRAEIDPSIEDHLDSDATIIDSAFFDFAKSPDDARDRIARYLAIVRPGLKRRAIGRGQLRFLVGGVGIATVLSWTERPSKRPPSVTDKIVVHALGRVCHLWDGDREELATALGVDVDGYFIGGRAEQEARRAIEGIRGRRETPSPHRIYDELTKLVRIAASRAPASESPTERALTAHKLGLEVVAPDIRDELLALNELGLQRRLCRFLFERNIRAFGTKIGWSELDVRAEDGIAALLMETKKETGRASIRRINKWLTQLGSYMDQEHRAARGALLIYNFGDIPILAPKETLFHRYLVVVVNLCAKPPSGRGDRIDLTEGSLSNPLRLARGDEQRDSVPRRRGRHATEH